jgi:folate-binding protein YgfZ
MSALPDGVTRYRTSHPGDGHLLVGPEPDLARALVGVEQMDTAAFDRHRVARAIPAWGREIGPERFPPEVGFFSSVSYTKGCFMGQEPLARLHSRGRANWQLVRVRSDEPGVPGSLPVALASEARAEAGTWTTAVAEGEAVLGLAVVHRTAAEPGVRLRADSRELVVEAVFLE